MLNKGKLISFRANEEDLEIMNTCIKSESSIRTLGYSDIIRYGLKMVGTKKGIKSKPFVGIDMAEGSDNSVIVTGEKKDGNVEIKNVEIITGPIYKALTNEEIQKEYKYIEGVLCDKDGYPVEELNGDMVERGGEVYAIEPRKEELKEKAKENSEKILKDTPFGKVNPAMAAVLQNSEKVDVLQKHAEPGLLNQPEGIDEEFIGDGEDEERFIE